MNVSSLKNKKRPAEIWLVEDNRGDVVLATRAFREARMANRITAVNNAEQALAMLRARDGAARDPLPDVIVLDLNLPKMNGLQFLEIVKADPMLRHIPVIVLSSSRADQDVVKSYGLHASGYVVKPVELEKFGEFVSAIEEFFFMLVLVPDIGDIERSA